MSYLKVTKNNTNYRFSIKSANDKTSSLFPAIKTVKYTSGNNVTIPLSNTSYTSGKTYYVNVKFRTRGDGDSTSSKCSSIGFIANKPDWSNSYSYIHNSATAYAERGQIVEWTYQFTATATDTRSTALYFIVNNGWANGADNQTIDLFYYKFWDSDGNVFDEEGIASPNIITNLKWKNENTLVSAEKLFSKSSATSTYTETFPILTPQAFYCLSFDLKKSSEEPSSCSFGYIYGDDSGGHSKLIGTINSGKIKNFYTHHNLIFLTQNFIVKNAFAYGFTLELNSPAKFYIKNIKLKRCTYNFKPYFFKIMKSSIIYYFLILKAYPKSGLRLKKNNDDYYYLSQSLSEYKYSELNLYYSTLYNGFNY